MLNLLCGAFRNVSFATLIALTVPALAVAQNQSETANGAPDAWSHYISASDLSDIANRFPDFQVIDIRDEKYLSNGAIPGAVWISFSEWRGPSDRPGQPPNEEQLEALIGSNGINPDLPIVIHNHSDHVVQTGRAAIVYWILKTAGAEHIAILDGGFKAYQEAGLPISPEATVLDPLQVDLTIQYDWWADPLDIFAVTSGQEDGAILDARLDAQVKKSVETGKPLMSMPMAQYIPSSFFTNDLSAKNLTEDAQIAFRSELEERGVDLGTGVLISICQTGELSAVSWFYASEVVGIENVLYYPDALQGWKSDGGLMFGMTASR